MGLDLAKIRKDLDDIDAQIVALYKERMEKAAEVAAYKLSTGKPVLDMQREREKLEAVTALVAQDFEKVAVEELYKQIMTASRRYQYTLLSQQKLTVDLGFLETDTLPNFGKKQMDIVYQGLEGAYSSIAAKAYFGKEHHFYPVQRFEEAIYEIQEGRADYAVIPIDNSSAGMVVDTYDLLSEYAIYIVGEYFLNIHHNLIGLQQASLEDIRTVYSHPQALMQCKEYIKEKGLVPVECLNTAIAANMIAQEQDKTKAAIASRQAAEINGLKILETMINRNEENTTRFIILTKEKIYQKAAKKISIEFTLPHRFGSLYNILGAFVFNGINMIKIESRPIKEKTWQYRFFIDIEGNLSRMPVLNALTQLQEETESLKILGNY